MKRGQATTISGMATTVQSFAKINLGLGIGPVRADGFHGLATVYQTLELHDLVTVAAERCGDRGSEIAISSNDARVPADGTNTCWKMVERWLKAAGVAAKVAIHIEKRLPVQGGLGAGSGNAVAAMIGLEAELGMRLPGGERLRIAEQVGSDVPLFVIGGTVLGLCRGEEVYPLPDLPGMDCVVAVPDVGVSTPGAFRDWDALQAAGGTELATAPTLTNAAEFDRLKGLSRAWSAALAGTHSSGVFPERADLAENPLLALVHAGIKNDFEQVVFPKYPLLREIKRVLAGSELDPEEAALYAALSGSGSALFGLYRSEAAALAAVRRVEAMGVTAYATRTRMRS